MLWKYLINGQITHIERDGRANCIGWKKIVKKWFMECADIKQDWNISCLNHHRPSDKSRSSDCRSAGRSWLYFRTTRIIHDWHKLLNGTRITGHLAPCNLMAIPMAQARQMNDHHPLTSQQHRFSIALPAHGCGYAAIRPAIQQSTMIKHQQSQRQFTEQ